MPRPRSASGRCSTSWSRRSERARSPRSSRSGRLRAAALVESAAMEPLYKPDGVEQRWQERWEADGDYNADPEPGRPTFVDAHPPPNVTGELHMGHALQLALGDALVRLKRM